MCDDSGRLVAWLDDELSVDDAAEVRRHLHGCAECRRRVRAYRDVSRAFAGYFDRSMTSSARHGWSGRLMILSGAMAAVVVALLVHFREPFPPPPVDVPEVGAASTAAEGTPVPPHAIPRVHRQRVIGSVPQRQVNWIPAEPAIQISIPADAVLPPGAAPDGVNFFVDVSLAADGSVQQVRVHP